MARKGRRRWNWRPTRADLYAVLGACVIIYEVGHEGRLGPMGVGLGLLGYRILAGPLQITGHEDPPPPPTPPPAAPGPRELPPMPGSLDEQP